MDKKTKYAVYIGIGVIALYFGYQWWKNRQNNMNGTSSGSSTALGTNLNSQNPYIGVPGQDSSGFSYQGGTVNVDVTEPVQQQPQPSGPPIIRGPINQPGSTGSVSGAYLYPLSQGSITLPGSAVTTNAMMSRVMPRSLNRSSTSVSNAVKRTPDNTKPRAMKRKPKQKKVSGR